MTKEFSGIILAAGYGTRMRSRHPKVLFPLLGRTLLEYPIRVLEQLQCQQIVVVVGAGADAVRAAFPGDRVTWATQDPPRGTGDAARVGLEALDNPDGPVVILNGDLPLLHTDSIAAMLDQHDRQDARMTLLTLDLPDPKGYGRIVRAADDSIAEIVEEADASPEQQAISEVNGGVYVAHARALREALATLESQESDNAQGELYLPPAIGPIRDNGGRISGWCLPEDDIWQLQQVNDRVELAKATAIRKEQIIQEHQRRGVTVVDPATTYIEEDVEIGQDTIVYPSSVILSGVRIANDCHVGPFAYLRVGTVLEERAEIGNFTEVKNTTMGPGSKAKHLSYLGDGQVGADANIGAGTIFANYDGSKKSETVIGEGAFVGSGTVFVAPVSLGAGAVTGAGAVVKRGSKIPPGETVVGVPARPLPKKPGD